MKTCKIILNLLLLATCSLNLFGQDFSYNILTNPDVENSKAYQNGNVYQRDFLLFADMLENTHPIFAEADKPHYDMDSLTKTGYSILLIVKMITCSNNTCNPFCHRSAMVIRL